MTSAIVLNDKHHTKFCNFQCKFGVAQNKMQNMKKTLNMKIWWKRYESEA